jgi:hypothetical protein
MKTHLLHYGSDFLPFLEMLPNLVDKDSAWALKVEHPADESDDSLSVSDEDSSEAAVAAPVAREADGRSSNSAGRAASLSAAADTRPSIMTFSRERKSSLPLSRYRDQNNVLTSPVSSGRAYQEAETVAQRRTLKELLRISQELAVFNPMEVAQELTRTHVKLFLDIEVCYSLPDNACRLLIAVFAAKTMAAAYVRVW